MVPVAEKHDDKRGKHHHTHKRVKDARQLRRAQYLHQPVEGREDGTGGH